MASHYAIATRSPRIPRGKWHLLVSPVTKRTICGQQALRWDTMPRDELDPRDICTNCLRDTPCVERPRTQVRVSLSVSDA